MADNDAKKAERERKKKERQRAKISLPSARRRLLQSREMAQGKRTYEDLWTLAGTILAFFAVMFVLLGGINQRKTVDVLMQWGSNIGNFVSHIVNPNMLDISENGVYIDPEKVGNNIEDLKEEQKEDEEDVENQETEEDKEKEENQ